MARNLLIWTALAALATLAAAGARHFAARRARQGLPTPYVRRQSALIAAGAFLLVGGLGGFLLGVVLQLPLPLSGLPGPEQARAQAQATELFRSTPLLRALAEAEPVKADELRGRFIHALLADEDPAVSEEPAAAGPGQPATKRTALIEQRLRDEACRFALGASLTRLGNASDEAAARLAEALLLCLKQLSQTDAQLCLGLLHPASTQYSAQADTALATLSGEARKKLEAALALVLASSSLRPQVAPLPSQADAALADMFSENLTEFQAIYGGPKEVRALFEALADPARSDKMPPDVLCAFAQDLLRALLRMPLTERGAGLRRLLGSS